MDTTLTITALATALSGVAVAFYKFLLDIIKEKNATIADRDQTIEEARRIQDATTQTLHQLVSAGLERLPSSGTEEHR